MPAVPALMVNVPAASRTRAPAPVVVASCKLSPAMAARWVAKNVVAAELASRCEVQLAYAIGVAEPVGVYFDTHGTGSADEMRIFIGFKIAESDNDIFWKKSRRNYGNTFCQTIHKKL